MIGIEINGQFLTLYPDTKVQITDDNDFWTGGDPLYKSSPRSFPFKIPTSINQYILLQSHLPESDYAFRYFENVNLFVGDGINIGSVLYTGTLYIRESDERDTEVFFVASVPELSEKKFGDYDIGRYEVTTIENPDYETEAIAHAMEVVADPLNWNHGIFPIFNDGFKPGNVKPSRPSNDYSAWQNYWSVEADQFLPLTVDGDDRFISWFLRVDFLLAKAAELIGYHLENLLQTVDEFRLLYLYNNYHGHIDIISEDPEIIPARKWDPVIDYNKLIHPEMGLTEFIKIIASRFFCMVYPDTIEKKLWIIPLRDILTAPHEFDFTAQAISGISTTTKEDLPSMISFDVSKDDLLVENNPYIDITQLPHGDPTESLDTEPPSGDGWYYMVSRDFYQYNDSGQSKTYTFFDVFRTTNKKGKPFTIKGAPLFQGVYGPMCRILGNVNGSGSIYPDIRLMLYRGLKTIEGNLRPYASNNAWDPDTSSEAYAYGLLINRDTGVSGVWIKEWLWLLSSMKPVKLSLTLSLDQILKLRPWHKIMVGSNIYLIKSKSVTFSMTGISPVECTLIRCN